MIKCRVLLPLLALLGGACTSDRVTATGSPSIWSERDAVSRFDVPVALDTLWQIGGPGDTTLLNPAWLSGGSEGVTVWDQGRKAVVRITPEGNVAWSFGRDGEGPGEFRLVRGIAHLSNGGVAAVDTRNGRLTILDVSGRLEHETTIDAGSLQSVAALPDGRIVTLVNATEPFAFFDQDGQYLHSSAFPWDGFGEVPFMVTQGISVGTDRGFVFGFIIGNGWWWFGEDGSAQGFPYAEHTDFPEVRTEVSATISRTTLMSGYVRSAVSLGTRADTLFVHFAGRGEDSRRLVDLFDAVDGTYQGSFLLPMAARRIAFVDDLVYTLTSTPFPVLSAFRRIEPVSQ